MFRRWKRGVTEAITPEPITVEALRWLEHVVRVRGLIDYVYFTRNDRFLQSLRGNRQFRELMTSAEEQYERFTDDGAPTLPHQVEIK